jgi:hypothetical protein
MQADHISGAKRGRARREPPPLLTKTELKVYAALEDLWTELGFAPTLVQIAARIGWSPTSKGSVSRVISQLRRKGLVAGAGRSLRPLPWPGSGRQGAGN